MKNNKVLIGIASAIFLVFAAFWAYIAINGLQGDKDIAEAFSATYGLMALFGGVVGLKVSKRWGGYKSLIGKSVFFMSLGLLAQEAGQLTYSGYTYIAHKEIPYPSLGDIFFFGSVILYILAAWSLVKALSTKTATRNSKYLALAFIVPATLLGFSYYIFLRGHSIDFSHPLTMFLDFGYPLGQAIYVSLAIMALILSVRYLGGIMKPVILFVIFALVFQYIADFGFLYQVSRETWKTAGINELVYLISYFVMTLSLIEFDRVLNRLSGKAKSEDK